MKKLCNSLIILAALGTFSIGPAKSLATPDIHSGVQGARRIKPEDLIQLLKQGQAIVVDVRTEEAYKAGHIKGALLIPAAEISKRAGELPRDKLIATYCS